MIRAPQAVKIKEIIDETPTIKTFKFDTDIKANPGEFLMVWNVSDEKPMSISNIGDNELSITVKDSTDPELIFAVDNPFTGVFLKDQEIVLPTPLAAPVIITFFIYFPP